MAKPKTEPKAKPPPASEAFFRPFAKIAAEKKKADAEAKKSEAKSTAAAKSPPAPKKKPQEAVEPMDRDTFALYMSGVRALDGGAIRVPLSQSRVERAAPVGPRPDADAPAREALRSLVAEGVRFETTDDGHHLEGRRLDTDPRDLRRLRRGQYATDGRLDLHGLGVAEARAAVETFIEKRAKIGDVMVVLIHGKGEHSPRGQAVLRGEIGAWLSHGRASRHVRAFTTADVEDGGAGALLVLLAR